MDAAPYEETVLEHDISSLISQQFPAFYREHGPILVEFTKQYYKWLGSSQVISNTAFVGKGYVTTNARSANVVGFGTDFQSFFANGDTIALYKQDTEENYDLLTIQTVVNSSLITLSSDTLPDFSSSNSWYTDTYLQYNPNYYIRRYMENKDIDLTIEPFLIYFKEKYLKNIQFDTSANIKNLLKHSLDIYRSKGTERAVDLLFRAVFGLPATIYYPGDDVFKLSDGKWYRPTYLEISMKAGAEKLVGKQIVGATSGALGFAEALVRRNVKGRLIDVMYISAVNGNFVVDELINSSDTILQPFDCPKIIGSLTQAVVDLQGTGANYAVGDIVDIYSDYGEQGKAKVESVSNTTGQVIFTLLNGGYAYRAESQVLVSSKIVTVANVGIVPTNNGKNYVYMFDDMVEPLGNVTYSAITSNLVGGEMVYTYDGSNVLQGTGIVLQSTPNAAATGMLLISVLSGSLNGFATIHVGANVKSITVNAYTDATTSANVIGYYGNTVFTFANKVGTFLINEEVYQTDQYGLELANGTMSSLTVTSGSNGEIRIANTYGVFLKNSLMRGRVSNASANIQSITLFVGVTTVSNTLYSNSYVYFANSGSNGTITNISAGSLANVGFSNALIFTESVSLANDYIQSFLSTPINALAYAFPAFPSGNLTNGTLSQMFANQTYTIGKIQQLEGVNKGTDYNLAPIVRIYDPVTSHRYKQDLILNITNSSGTFKVGEIITQTTPNSRGIIKTANSSQIWIEQLRLDDANTFVTTSTTDTLAVGAESMATANVTSVVIDNRSEYLGFNALIDTQVKASPGAITNVSIISSGFGYKQNDSLRFVPTGSTVDNVDAGLGFATLINQGQGEGYYKRKGGWLSDQSRLYDGLYYQEYSYEVRASITLSKYEEMLKQILHIAGTKYFGALVYRSYISVEANVISTTITQE